MNPTKRDLAWVAGLIEGEGSIQISRLARSKGAESYGLVVVVAMTDAQCVQELHRIFGGTLRNRDKPKGNRRASFQWQVSSARAGEVLRALLPYFRSDRVRQKAILGLEFQWQKQPGGRARWMEGYRDRQREFFVAMRVLNVRGVANRKYA